MSQLFCMDSSTYIRVFNASPLNAIRFVRFNATQIKLIRQDGATPLQALAGPAQTYGGVQPRRMAWVESNPSDPNQEIQ